MCCRMSNCVSWFWSHYNETHLVLQLCWELSKRHLINVALLRGARVMVLKVEVFHLIPQQTKSKQLQRALSLSYTKSATPTSGTQRFVMTSLHFPWEKISPNWVRKKGSENSPSAVSTESQICAIYKLIFCFHSLISLSYSFSPLLFLSTMKASFSLPFSNSLG